MNTPYRSGTVMQFHEWSWRNGRINKTRKKKQAIGFLQGKPPFSNMRLSLS
jgi:hypothetical protein